MWNTNVAIKAIVTILIVTYLTISVIGCLYGLSVGLLSFSDAAYAILFPDKPLSNGVSLLYIVNDLLGLHIMLRGYEAIYRGYVWEFITSMLIHANVLHLIVNVVALIISSYIITSMESIKELVVIATFTLSGVSGNVSTAILLPSISSVGSSGAIFGLLAYVSVKDFRSSGSYSMLLLLLIVFIISSLPIIGYPNLIAHATGLLIGLVIGVLT